MIRYVFGRLNLKNLIIESRYRLLEDEENTGGF